MSATAQPIAFDALGDRLAQHERDFFARDYANGNYEDVTLDTLLAHMDKFGPDGVMESALHLPMNEYATLAEAHRKAVAYRNNNRPKIRRRS